MSPRLFTASDVERAARLAAREFSSAPGGRDYVESVVAKVMDTVASESQPFYSETEVKQMLQYLLTKEDVEAEFEDALNMVRR